MNLRRFFICENRIYIMPTGGGFMFLSAIVVLILTASTYNNNLVFILAFFLFAVFVVSMLQTHYNLKGVRIQFLSRDENFAGQRLHLTFSLSQKRPRRKTALHIRTRGKIFPTVQSSPEHLKPRESTKPVKIEVEATRRGRHALPEMILETRFPLGLFRAWKVFRPQAELLVYPRPETLSSLAPQSHDQGEEKSGHRHSPDGDFGELKNHLPGESYHQIAWKHFARTGLLYTKVHWGAADRHYIIPWLIDDQLDKEKRLMQMSAWVQTAQNENASFEMSTPHLVIPPGRGLDHARDCWRALARVSG